MRMTKSDLAMVTVAVVFGGFFLFSVTTEATCSRIVNVTTPETFGVYGIPFSMRYGYELELEDGRRIARDSRSIDRPEGEYCEHRFAIK